MFGHLRNTAIAILILLAGASSSAFSSELEPLYPNYPSEFDVVGVIDYLSDKYFVINDLSYAVQGGSSFHTPNGAVSAKSFSIGDKIGVLLEEGSNNTIKSMWYIEASIKDNSKQGQPSKQEEMQIEKGVWKN